MKEEQAILEKTQGYISNGLVQNREFVVEINNNELKVKLGG